MVDESYQSSMRLITDAADFTPEVDLVFIGAQTG